MLRNRIELLRYDEDISSAYCYFLFRGFYAHPPIALGEEVVRTYAANDDNQSISTTFDEQPGRGGRERIFAFAGHTFPHDPLSVGSGSETRHKQNGFRKGDEIGNVTKAYIYLKWLYQPVNDLLPTADVD